MNDSDVALVPDNDEFADDLAQGSGGNVKYFGAECFEEFEGVNNLGLEGTEIYWAGEKIHFALPGRHSFEDAMAAVAIAKEIPVSVKAIKQGLESVKPLFGRLEILNGRTTVIRDCYNANPESAAGCIEFCDSLEWPGRKVYVIADMLELGGNSAQEHEKIGFLLAVSSAKMVFLFGKEIEKAADCLADNGKKFFYTNDIDKLSGELDSYVKHGDLVLLKGSRGCALERLSDMLLKVNGTSIKVSRGGF